MPVDGGLDQLRIGAVETGPFGELPQRQHVVGDTGTSSNTTVPLAVVRWPKEDQSSMTLSPRTSRGDQTCTARPASSSARAGTSGRTTRRWVEAAPAQAQAVLGAHRARGAVQDGGAVGRAPFGAGIAQPRAGQYLAVETALLRFAADLAQHAQQAEMVLRDLAQRRVGGARMTKTSASVA